MEFKLSKNDMIEYGILIAIIGAFVVVDASYFKAVTESLVGRIFLFSSVVYTYYKKGTQSAIILAILIAVLMMNLKQDSDLEGMDSEKASVNETPKEDEEEPKQESEEEVDADGNDISSGDEVKEFEPDLIALEHILQRTATPAE